MKTDEYGKYEDISIAGITQRFRRIFPGSFIMGSPQDEPGRNDDERQHPVTLTKGFLMADTACPQRLWEAVIEETWLWDAVIKENPSRFKGDNRPVETVSWNNCIQFIGKLNEVSPGGFRLPTEAEWEYCCRAGTTTPFSFGRQIDTEEVNYNDYPYNDAKEGKYRGETVDVKSLPPNPWGLYGMHGNVWEWCWDRYGKYPAGRVIDPTGPKGGMDRVLRGGSWIDVARFARSASRFSIGDYGRDNVTGFRLAMN